MQRPPQLPRAIPFAQTLETIDVRQGTARAVADAGGVITASFDPVDPTQLWLVDRIIVSSTSTLATACRVYIDQADPTRLIDGTSSGNLDIADEPQGALVESGQQLLVVWTGASINAVGTVRIQYRVMTRRAYAPGR